MRLVRDLFKRHITETPDRYRASVSFPAPSDEPPTEGVYDRIEDLERAFEGRLDVYARRRWISVVTDSVPAEQVDVSAFERALERTEAGYAGTHTLARVEKWRSLDDYLLKSVIAVPVKPLFPRE